MTPAELRTAAAQVLGLIPDGGAPLSAAAAAKINQRYVGLHAQLLEHELATWAVAENIPAKCQNAMILMLAAACVDISGLGAEKRAELTLKGGLDLAPVSLAERQLRKALAGKNISQPVPTDYF